MVVTCLMGYAGAVDMRLRAMIVSEVLRELAITKDAVPPRYEPSCFCFWKVRRSVCWDTLAMAYGRVALSDIVAAFVHATADEVVSALAQMACWTDTSASFC